MLPFLMTIFPCMYHCLLISTSLIFFSINFLIIFWFYVFSLYLALFIPLELLLSYLHQYFLKYCNHLPVTLFFLLNPLLVSFDFLPLSFLALVICCFKSVPQHPCSFESFPIYLHFLGHHVYFKQPPTRAIEIFLLPAKGGSHKSSCGIWICIQASTTH